jgi:hypothetical protein
MARGNQRENAREKAAKKNAGKVTLFINTDNHHRHPY